MESILDLIKDENPEAINDFLNNQEGSAESLQRINEARKMALELCKEGKINLQQMQLFFSTGFS